MTNNDSIANQLSTYLASLPILTVVPRLTVVQTVATVQEKAKVLAALEYYTANTGVSNRSDGRSRPKNYYGVKVSIEYAVNAADTLYFSLPGIPRQLLSRSVATAQVNQIIANLQAKYGAATIKYWCGSAQYRSVDFGRRGMNAAKQRDGNCRICQEAHKLCQQKGVLSQWEIPKSIIACHIVSRKTIFWSILAEIDQAHPSIFTDAATLDFAQRMKQNQLHSGSQYIVGLCQEHDKLLQSVLTKAAA